MGTQTPSVVIACGDALRARSVARAVEKVAGVAATVAWPVPAALLEVASGGAGVLVIDAPVGSTDLRALADLTAANREVAVLVIGPVDAPVGVMLMLASGVLGYLSADTSPTLVADAVTELVAGGTVLPSNVSRSLVEHLRDGGRIVVERCDGRAVQLTNREWEVLVLLGQGRTTSEIARSLVVSSGTVRSHVAALLRKLGVRDRRVLPAVVGIVPRSDVGPRARVPS